MKKLFLSLLAAGMLLSACNQAAKQAKTTDSTVAQPAAAGSAATTAAPAAAAVMSDGPQMKFEYTTHDFGKIQEGDKVTYKFNFANTGKSPLIIVDAVASCGCTIPTWPKAPIKPGDGGQIVVTFNSAGKKDLQDKMVTITANTNPRQNVVHLVGEVLEKK
jgi:uncharacterized cupredoxin-like copper-binding protein